MVNPPTEIIWRPQSGPQKALIDCPLPEIFYGGARGGGKTDGVLGKWAIKGETYGPHFNAIFFRRELPSADDAIERSQEIYGKLGWKWNATKYSWRSPRGARVRFRPLERAVDADKYQGQNVSDACVEEAGQYPDSRPIDRLNGVLRSAHGVPTQLLLTGNPGGAGQGWLRSRYVDPAPQGMTVMRRKLPSGREHRYVYIPSKLSNNRILTTNDPGYIDRLYQVGSAELVRAWLEGDWDAIEGAYFDCWRLAKHVIRPFSLPSWWLRFGSFDWGSASPFSYGWWAVSDGTPTESGKVFPKGALIRYREWYGGIDGVGLKMPNPEIARGILKMESEEERARIVYRVADPSIFKEDGGPSIAEQMAKEGVSFRRADNARAPGLGAISGWGQLRDRLLGEGSVGNEPGEPMVYAFSTCTQSIRTIPVLQHDDSRPEDVDTSGDDHCADEWRYACSSRPWIKSQPKDQPARHIVIGGVSTMTMDDLWKFTEPTKDSRL